MFCLHRHFSRKFSSKTFADTLQLPQTSFPLRSGTNVCHDASAVYRWQRDQSHRPEFILHDGPPYANGRLHIGHALNKITKDIICRYKIQRGYRVSYVPGWDCHGLPIELKALEASRKRNGFDFTKALNPVELRRLAQRFASQTIAEQRQQLANWSVMGDYENAYKTMDKEYVVRQLEVFRHMVKNGLIYRRKKPVYWSPSSKTALAEAELEYVDEHKSPSVFVKFPLLADALVKKMGKDVYLIVWTTTPWTLPGNEAIAVNPDMTYSVIKTRQQDIMIVSSERLNALADVVHEYEVLFEVIGQDLVGARYRPVFRNDFAHVLAAPFVTNDAGTGLVHIAPAHGEDDFELGQKHGLPLTSIVDEHGKFIAGTPGGFEGKSIHEDGTTAIIANLHENNLLLGASTYVHRYPYDWRTRKPVILRATEQWFVNLHDLKECVAKSIEKVDFVPHTAKHRLLASITSRREWCISRQRSWGVPIPAFFNIATGEPLLSEESVDHFIRIVREHGPDAWWTLPVEALVPKPYNPSEYRCGRDTMDVWFDSGTSWKLLENLTQKRPARADVYIEGSDQHRGWFQSSILTSTLVQGVAPFKQLITHGFVLDERGRKMSKSLGNVVDPDAITQSPPTPNGADALRLWVASSDYTSDVTIGKQVLANVTESLRKFRTSMRFLLGNLYDYQSNDVSTDLQPVDKYVLSRLQYLHERVTSLFDQFNFNRGLQEITAFTNTELSSFYFDISKDRLYADARDGASRRAVQFVLVETFRTLVSSLAPIVCHLTDEAFTHGKHFFQNGEEHVQQIGWYMPAAAWRNVELEKDFELLKYLRSMVAKELEIQRQQKLLRSSLDAVVELRCEQNCYRFLKQYEPFLANLFITSDCLLKPLNATHGIECVEHRPRIIDLPQEVSIRIQSSPKFKCPRCWVHASLSENALCTRCASVLSQ